MYMGSSAYGYYEYVGGIQTFMYWISYGRLFFCGGLLTVVHYYQSAFFRYFRAEKKLLPGKIGQHIICWGWASVATMIPFLFPRSYEANGDLDNGLTAGANFDCWIAQTPEYFYWATMFISFLSLLAFTVEYKRLNLAPIISRKRPLQRLHNFLRVVALTQVGAEFPRFFGIWIGVTQLELVSTVVYAVSGFVESLVWFNAELPRIRCSWRKEPKGMVPSNEH